NNQKNYKKDNFYIISIEIVFFHLSRNFMSQPLFKIDFECCEFIKFTIYRNVTSILTHNLFGN
ncbi:hypothetical protein, partial [Staphylococcus hominis]